MEKIYRVGYSFNRFVHVIAEELSDVEDMVENTVNAKLHLSVFGDVAGKSYYTFSNVKGLSHVITIEECKTDLEELKKAYSTL